MGGYLDNTENLILGTAAQKLPQMSTTLILAMKIHTLRLQQVLVCYEVSGGGYAWMKQPIRSHLILFYQTQRHSQQ